MKIRIQDIFFYGVFSLVFIALFMLNNNRENPQNEQILNLILSCFTLIFFIQSILFLAANYVKFSRNDFVLFSCLISCAIVTFIVRSFLSVHWIYLLAAFCIAKSDLKIYSKYFNTFILLGFISIIVQFFNNRNHFGNFVLSWQDPNYSGLVIFFFAMLLYKLQKKYLMYAALFLGFLTLSRAFFVAVLIFLLLKIPFIQKIALRPIFFNTYSYFLIVLALPFITAPIYLNYIEKHQDQVVDNIELAGSHKRLTSSYLDKSNTNRFTANILFFEDIIKHPQNYIFGRPLEEYTKNVFQNAPHNVVGQLVLNYGLLFAFFYLIILFRCIKPFFVKGNELVLYPLVVYLLFLGGVWMGISVIFFTILLKLNFKNGAKN